MPVQRFLTILVKTASQRPPRNFPSKGEEPLRTVPNSPGGTAPMTTTATELLEEFRQLAAEQGPDITLFKYRRVPLLASPAVF